MAHIYKKYGRNERVKIAFLFKIKRNLKINLSQLVLQNAFKLYPS